MSPFHFAKPCLTAICLSLLLAKQAAAGPPLPGIRFDLMPVGCEVHGVYSSGKKIVDEYDEYIGVSGQSYVITTMPITAPRPQAATPAMTPRATWRARTGRV